MRLVIYSLLFSSLLSSCFGSCNNDPPDAGTLDRPCRSWPGLACDSNLLCNEGWCRECGALGERCCPGSPRCHAGHNCVWTADSVERCGDCGDPGERCCAFSWCTSGNMCSTSSHRCEPAASTPCTGPHPFDLYLRDRNRCAGGPLRVFAADRTEALECARGAIAGTGWQVNGFDAWRVFEYCIDPRFGFPDEGQVSAFSQADADICAEAVLCGGDCTLTRGRCP